MTAPALPLPAPARSAAPGLIEATFAFLKKDLGEIWIGWVALMGLAVMQTVRPGDFIAIVNIVLVALVARWILTDPLADPDALWRTLPLRPATVIGAKLIAVFALVVLPLLALEAYAAWGAGLRGAALALALLEALLFAATLIIATAAVAASCRDFPRFLMAAMGWVAGLVAGLIGLSMLRTHPAMLASWPRPPLLDAAIVLVALALFTRALARATAPGSARRSMGWVAAGLVLLFFGSILARLVTSDPGRSDPALEQAAAGTEISLLPVPKSSAGIADWPSGVIAVLALHAPDSAGSATLLSLDGALHLDGGRTIPVSDWLRHTSRSIYVNPTGDGEGGRVVRLFDLFGADLDRLGDATGTLDLRVGYRVSAPVMELPSSNLRVTRIERQAGARLEVLLDRTLFPEPGTWISRGTVNVRLWDPAHRHGYELQARNGSSETHSVGLFPLPWIGLKRSPLEIDLDRAIELPSGLPATNAAEVLTDRWLAHADVEIGGLRWTGVLTRNVVVDDFRIGDWTRD